MTASYSSVGTNDLHGSLAVEAGRDGVVTAEVQEGWDVFGVPHGGYLAALTAAAALASTRQPDVFTITIHYLRKASLGPLRFSVERVGGSRRLTSVTVRAVQGDRVVLSAMASVGDRVAFDGPTWSSRQPWDPGAAQLSAPADAEGRFAAPLVAQRCGLRLDEATAAFARGERDAPAELRGVMRGGHPLAPLIACDVTPPAIWNALGAAGWVPTSSVGRCRGR